MDAKHQPQVLESKSEGMLTLKQSPSKPKKAVFTHSGRPLLNLNPSSSTWATDGTWTQHKLGTHFWSVRISFALFNRLPLLSDNSLEVSDSGLKDDPVERTEPYRLRPNRVRVN